MEANTRVKKYEDLRETLLKENQELQGTPKLSRFAKRLSNIDADYFQPIVENYENDLKKEEIQPQRAMTTNEEIENSDDYFNEQEILSRALRITSQNKESSDDELLNQFLKEIRNYNKKQGVRSVDDTRMEILKQVKVETGETENNSRVEKIDEPISNEENPARFSIAKQVKDMLKTQDLKVGFEEEKPSVKEKSISHTSERYLQALDEDRANRAKILEETQQLRLKLNEHEDELDEIGTGIDYTRKLLNVLLALLMITVLIAGGILAYLVMRG